MWEEANGLFIHLFSPVYPNTENNIHFRVVVILFLGSVLLPFFFVTKELGCFKDFNESLRDFLSYLDSKLTDNIANSY